MVPKSRNMKTVNGATTSEVISKFFLHYGFVFIQYVVIIGIWKYFGLREGEYLLPKKQNASGIEFFSC